MSNEQIVIAVQADGWIGGRGVGKWGGRVKRKVSVCILVAVIIMTYVPIGEKVETVAQLNVAMYNMDCSSIDEITALGFVSWLLCIYFLLAEPFLAEQYSISTLSISSTFINNGVLLHILA
jgi:hypothetical protein